MIARTLHTLGALALFTAAAFAQTARAPTQVVAQIAAGGRAAAPEARALKLDGRPIALGGALAAPQAWLGYKQRFVTSTGRVIDTANGFISHSEGQGYGMLLAVAANDRPTFDRIWGWTRANLMVRDDQLMAWRWAPGQRPAVADMNNATDGDILVAWALAEAAEFWGEASYRAAGRRIAVEVGRKLVMFKTPQGALILPGVAGFSASERPDGPVINLSYYVFPAFARLALVAPEIDWPGLTATGLELVKTARFGEAQLPSDWIALRDGAPKPAQNFPPQFSYNAIRVPLYLAWAGVGDWEHFAAFAAWANPKRGALGTVDVVTGREADRLGERGYMGIAHLLACAIDRTAPPADFRQPRDGEHYYSATIQLMAMTAVNMRYASCLKN